MAKLTNSSSILNEQGDLNYFYEIQRESLWVMSNCIICGFHKQAKDLYDLCAREKTIATDDTDDTEYNEGVQDSNILLKGIIRGAKTIQDADLLVNLLEALTVLFQVDEMYQMSLPDPNNDALNESIME